MKNFWSSVGDFKGKAGEALKAVVELGTEPKDDPDAVRYQTENDDLKKNLKN